VKYRSLIAVFISMLLFSILSVTLATVCPRCDGTGEIICPYCDGEGEVIVEEGAPCESCSGSGILEPVIILKSRSAWLNNGKISAQATYENTESVDTYGRVTAEVEVNGNTYSATSSRVLFPANENSQVSITIDGISSADYNTLQAQQVFSTSITLDADEVGCPYCDGTGLTPASIECPQCGGIGFIECPECGGSGIEGGEQNAELDIGGTTYGVAAVAVVAGVAVAGFVLVKKRGVKEEDLRKMALTEFQDWVIKRMGGKSASQSDARMGIDGYTLDGQPLSIKQEDGVGMNAIEKFSAAMARRNSKNGMVVAFSFGTDSIRGRVRAKMNYGFEIQMVTVSELIDSRNRSI
jgi:hypothetical protein